MSATSQVETQGNKEAGRSFLMGGTLIACEPKAFLSLIPKEHRWHWKSCVVGIGYPCEGPQLDWEEIDLCVDDEARQGQQLAVRVVDMLAITEHESNWKQIKLLGYLTPIPA